MALKEAGIPEAEWAVFKPGFARDYRKPLRERDAVIRHNLSALEREAIRRLMARSERSPPR